MGATDNNNRKNDDNPKLYDYHGQRIAKCLTNIISTPSRNPSGKVGQHPILDLYLQLSNA